MLSTASADRLRVAAYTRPPSDLERHFYENIVHSLRQRRQSLGLTQEELDHRIGVGDGQVAKWESMDRLPGAFMFVCWSNSLGLILSFDQPPQERQAA